MKTHPHKTPLLRSIPLSHKMDKNVFLKLENLQPTGSFKVRGIEKLCRQAKERGVSSFVASSAGNAGYSVAYVANKLGIEATVFVPKQTSERVIDLLTSLEANVKVTGESWNDAHQAALNYTEKVNGEYIHPFDHEVLWEGHSTMMDEVALEMSKPDAIILSVGGGGLLSGVVQGLENNDWANVPILAVETEGANSFNQSIKQNWLVKLDSIDTVAKSLGASQVCSNALELSKKYNISSVVVSDQVATNACYEFSKDHRFIVEPACGASLSLVYSGHPTLKDKQTILVIVCGGILSNVEDIIEWKN